MLTFLKFLFFITIRIVISLSVLGFLIFLLWGVLYLLFIK